MNQGIVDTQRFNDILKETGDAAGAGASAAIQEYGSFEKSLRKGWVSANILKDSVNRLTQEVNGYDDAKKQNLGITNEQINQLNALNAGLQNGSISADDFAKKMQRMSGRENVIQGLANVWNSLKTIIQAVGKAWDEVMPSMNGETIYALTEAFRKFTEGLKPSPQLLNVIGTTTKVVATAFKLLLGAVGLVVKGFGVLLGFAGKSPAYSLISLHRLLMVLEPLPHMSDNLRLSPTLSNSGKPHSRHSELSSKPLVNPSVAYSMACLTV